MRDLTLTLTRAVCHGNDKMDPLLLAVTATEIYPVHSGYKNTEVRRYSVLSLLCISQSYLVT